MTDYIVFKKGDARAPKDGDTVLSPNGEIRIVWIGPAYGSEHRVVERLPDAEVEALEARLAEAESWKARAKKAEADYLACAEAAGVVYASDGRASHPGPVGDVVAAIKSLSDERDDLRAKVDECDSRQTGIRIALDAICPDMDGQRVIDPIERITRLGAEVARLRRMFESSGTPGSLADDARAQFERETAARLLAGSGDFRDMNSAIDCARRIADHYFGPAPAPVKADAPPQFKVGDRVAPLTAEELELCRLPSRLAGVGATLYEKKDGRAFIGFDSNGGWWIDERYVRPAPPAEPWTPKVKDEVKIVASTFTPTDASRAMIGTRGKVLEMYTDFRGKIARVGECWFHASNLELVRRAEDAAS